VIKDCNPSSQLFCRHQNTPIVRGDKACTNYLKFLLTLDSERKSSTLLQRKLCILKLVKTFLFYQLLQLVGTKVHLLWTVNWLKIYSLLHLIWSF